MTTKLTIEEGKGMRKGDIIRREGKFLRIAKIEGKRAVNGWDAVARAAFEEPAHFAVEFAESTEEKYASRPVRFSIPAHEVELFGYAPCRQIESGEWAQISEVKHSTVRGAADSTRVYLAFAKIASEKKAAKLNAAYAAKQAAKSAEVNARQTADYR